MRIFSLDTWTKGARWAREMLCPPYWLLATCATICVVMLHAVEKLCGACGVDKQAEKLLTYLASAGGSCATVTEGLKNVTSDIEILAAADALNKVCRAAEETGVTVRADFSLTGDINYYNGVVFKGYVKGVPAGILSGGQYDGLMAKMNKKSGAVGFAVYADLLERVGARGADNGKE